MEARSSFLETDKSYLCENPPGNDCVPTATLHGFAASNSLIHSSTAVLASSIFSYFNGRSNRVERATPTFFRASFNASVVPRWPEKFKIATVLACLRVAVIAI